MWRERVFGRWIFRNELHSGFTNTKIFRSNDGTLETIPYFPYHDDYTDTDYEILPTQKPDIYELCRETYNTDFDPESVLQALKDLGLLKVEGISNIEALIINYIVIKLISLRTSMNNGMKITS